VAAGVTGRRWRLALIALGLGAAACGRPVLAPSAARAPIALAGQSNAVFLWPFVVQAAAPIAIVGVAEDGSSIAEWGVTGALWPQLVPALHQPLRAFVWWQGESDKDSRSYPADLVTFLARVRSEANSPRLRVVVCRVVDDPAFVALRLAQAAYVEGDAQSVLVSSDGLEREHPDWLSGSAHLSPAGYRLMAQRILVAVFA